MKNLCKTGKTKELIILSGHYTTHLIYVALINSTEIQTESRIVQTKYKRNVENYATYKTMKNIKIKKYSKNLFKSFIFVHIKANANTNTIQLYISTEYTTHK